MTRGSAFAIRAVTVAFPLTNVPPCGAIATVNDDAPGLQFRSSKVVVPVTVEC